MKESNCTLEKMGLKLISLTLLFFLVSSLLNLTYSQTVTNNSQWGKNGPASAPANPVIWANGNAQGTNSHFAEGQSVPTRIEVTGLTAGIEATLTFNINIVQGSNVPPKHAFDFFTGPNRIAEAVQPLDGLTGYGAVSYFPIPVPSSAVAAGSNGYATGGPFTETAQKMQCLQTAEAGTPSKNSLWSYNATVSKITYVWGNEFGSSTQQTYCTVTFTPTSTKALFAIGCHIAAEQPPSVCTGWGLGNGATAIGGSPYHFHIESICQPVNNCITLGSQDQQMATSAVVTPPTCTISPDATICQGSTTTFTAAGVGGSGGSPYTFAWTGPGGYTANTASITVGTEGTYFVTVTDNGGNSTMTPCSVVLTVNNVTPGTIAASQTICAGGTIAPFTTSVAATGSGTLTYQWQSAATCAGPWTNIASATSATYTATGAGAYQRVTTSTLNGVVCTAASNCVTITVNNVTPGTIAASQTVCSTSDIVPFTTSVAATGSGTLTYQWQSAATCAGPWTNIASATSATYTATGAGAYQRVTTSTLNGVVCTAASNCVTITVNNVTPGTIAASQTVCSTSDIVPFTTSVAATGSGTLTYQWQSAATCAGPWTNIASATSATYTATGAGAYQRVTTSTLNGVVCTAASNCVTITVNNVTPGTIAASQTVCSTSDIVPFTTSVAATGSGTLTYQWQSAATCAGPWTNIASATSATYTATGTGAYQRVTTSTLNGVACTAASNCVTITATSVTPGTIAASQTICAGGTIAPFTTSVAATGSGTLTYQWQSAATCAGPWTNIASATSENYTATGAGAYQRLTTSTLNGVACTAASNCVTITVNNVTPGTIAASQTVCSTSDIVPFTTSVAATGSGTLTYQWQSAATCAGPWTNIASATSATYTATGAGAYQRVTTSTLNGVVCTAASNCVTITVNNVTPGTIAASQTVCSTSDIVPFTTSVAATGSGTLTYQWQSAATCAGPWTNIASATSATYTATGTGAYQRVTTSTLNGVACTAASNCVTITATSVTPGTIAASQTICAGGTIAPFTTSVAATGSGTLTYQWQSAATCAGPWTNIASATSENYTATGAGAYQRLTTSTLNGVACTAASNCVTITVNNVTPGTIAASQTICAGGTIAPFTTSVAATGSGTLTYQWQSAATCAGPWTNIASATSATYTATGAGAYQRVTTSTLNGVVCTAASNCVTITVNNVTPGTIAASQTVCSTSDIVPFTTSVAATGSGTLTYQWQSAATCAGPWTNIASATSATYTATGAGAYQRVTTSTLNGVVCTAASNCVTITVNNVTPGIIGGNAPICTGGDPGILTNVASPTGSGTLTYQWQNGAGTCETATFTNIGGANGATYDPPAGLTVTTSYQRIATYTLNGVICSAKSNCITVIVVENPIIYVPTASPYCAGDPAKGSVTLPGSQIGVNYQLKDDAFNNVQSPKPGTGSSLTWTGLDAGGYLVQASGSGPTNCANLTQPAVVIENQLPNPMADNKTICLGDCVTLTGTPAGGMWSGTGVSGSQFCSTGLAAGPYTVTYSVTNGVTGCTNSATAIITVNICGGPICTYTQGYYGNPKGTSCDGTTGGFSTDALIAKSLGNYPGGMLVVGKAGSSVVLSNTVAARQCIIDKLPGGGGSKELLTAEYGICSLPASYLKNGRINNVLLSQTIALGLNIGITSPSTLGSFALQPGVLATAMPVGGCGSSVPKTRVCVYNTVAPYQLLSVTNEYTYRTISTAVYNAITPKTVAGLMELANKALANTDGVVGSENGVSLSEINNAVSAINEVFDECRIFIGWNVAPCAPNQVPLTTRTALTPSLEVATSKISVSTYPNPFRDQVKFEIKSPVSGNGKIDVYSVTGQKMGTINIGQVFAGNVKTVNYQVPPINRTNLIYILSVGNDQVIGKLTNIK